MKRFTEEAEILELIDKYSSQLLTLEASANNMDRQADSFRGTENAFQINGIRDLSFKIRARVTWRYQKLNQLKEKLQEFRTQPLVGVIDDGSVEAI